MTATGVPAAFTSIPGTYADLVLVIRGRASNAVAEQIVTIQFNGDTAANYDYGASFEVNTYGQTTGIGATSMTLGGIVGDTAPANYPSHLEAVVSNYAGTTFYKNVMAESREEKAASSTGLVEWIAAGTWKSTAAINQLAVLTSLKAGSIVSLYGRS